MPQHAAACRSMPQRAAAQEIFPRDRTCLAPGEASPTRGTIAGNASGRGVPPSTAVRAAIEGGRALPREKGKIAPGPHAIGNRLPVL